MFLAPFHTWIPLADHNNCMEITFQVKFMTIGSHAESIFSIESKYRPKRVAT